MSAASDPDPRRARVRIGVGAALVLLLAALAVAVLVAALSAPGASTVVRGADAERGAFGEAQGAADSEAADAGDASPAPDAAVVDDASAVEPADEALVVHVLGAVAEPGLYEFADGARVVDAVAAAGGFLRRADRGALNLARPLADGEQLLVLAKGQRAAPPSGSGGTGASPGTPGAPAPSSGSGAPGPVNLNTADLAALDTLPRIGPALAQRILDWRTANGAFASVEDLMAVPGIGEATFEGLRALVTT